MDDVIDAAQRAVKAVLCRSMQEIRATLKASVFEMAFESKKSPEEYVVSLSCEDFKCKTSSLGAFDLFKSAKDLFHNVGYGRIASESDCEGINLKSPAALALIRSGSATEECSPESLAEFANALLDQPQAESGLDSDLYQLVNALLDQHQAKSCLDHAELHQFLEAFLNQHCLDGPVREFVQTYLGHQAESGLDDVLMLLLFLARHEGYEYFSVDRLR